MPHATVSVFGSMTWNAGSPGSTSPRRPAITWLSSGVMKMLCTVVWTGTLFVTLCVAMSMTSTMLAGEPVD
jgi:hypothetical protein